MPLQSPCRQQLRRSFAATEAVEPNLHASRVDRSVVWHLDRRIEGRQFEQGCGPNNAGARRFCIAQPHFDWHFPGRIVEAQVAVGEVRDIAQRVDQRTEFLTADMQAVGTAAELDLRIHAKSATGLPSRPDLDQRGGERTIPRHLWKWRGSPCRTGGQ